MEFLTALLSNTILQVLTSFSHNWPFLVASILVAVLLKLYVDPQKVSAFLIRYRRAGVIGATVAAVGTPLCSCGTTAIMLGMMASMMPWAPIVAFMVASPLTSPEELFYSAGLFGWPFTLAFFIASIVLGLLGGLAAGILESRGLLKNQTRMTDSAPAARTRPAQPVRPAQPLRAEPSVVLASLNFSAPALATCGCSGDAEAQRELLPSYAFTAQASGDCGCEDTPPVSVGGCACDAAPAAPTSGCACGAAPVAPATGCSCDAAPAEAGPKRVTLRMFWDETFATAKRLLVMFAGFAFIGYFINGLIPASWIPAIFGSGHFYSIPLAATLGLPLYVNTEASLPLVRAMMDGGMSQGAALAFLITGAGTSVGAVAGALTIARWRVIALVIGTLWVGAIVIGYVYNLLMAL